MLRGSRMTLSPEQLAAELKRAILNVIDREIDKAVEELVPDIQSRIRQKIAGLAADVVGDMDFQRMGTDLTIRLKMNKTNERG